jgi:hypothetical protein
MQLIHVPVEFVNDFERGLHRPVLIRIHCDEHAMAQAK